MRDMYFSTDRKSVLINGDCLTEMDMIPDRSIDFIFTDLPYGLTKNSWDIPLDLEQMWKHYERIIKDDGCIALFAQSPYDKILAVSNLRMFRYEWIIEKSNATGFYNANHMPLKAHENILIFYRKMPKYFPQKTSGHEPMHFYAKKSGDNGSNYGSSRISTSGGGNTDRYPRDVLKIKRDTQICSLHPTQKSLELCKYFIKTYTSENDVVLDSCMGSGTVGLACRNLNRRFIGIEKEEKYFSVCINRIFS